MITWRRRQMERGRLRGVNVRLLACRAALMAVAFVCLAAIEGPHQAHADVPPPDEEACYPDYRVGDSCVTQTEEVPPKKLTGTCQKSLCPRWKRDPSPCVKCIPGQATGEKGTARELGKKAPHTEVRTDAGTSCSLARPGSGVRRIALWLAAGAIPFLFLVLRRRRD
jgi:hypothetical protein